MSWNLKEVIIKSILATAGTEVILCSLNLAKRDMLYIMYYIPVFFLLCTTVILFNHVLVYISAFLK